MSRDENKREQEKYEKIGEEIADILMLHKSKTTGRYKTAWGDKTTLGLFLTLKRIIEEGEVSL